MKKKTPRRKANSESIDVAASSGPFAEDKDIALLIRTSQIMPAMKQRRKVILDFGGVHLSTQSFIHALLSEVIRDEGSNALDEIRFRNCNPIVRSLIQTVAEYSQETDDHRQ
jgi:hypothetical protein